jgi:hypothetical protein
MNFLSHRLRSLAVPAGALSAGSLAALLGACCGAPWLVTVLGVSGAIAMARLAFLAPYLWLVAFGLAISVLIWAFRSQPNCEVACAPIQRQRRQIAAWFVLLTLRESAGNEERRQRDLCVGCMADLWTQRGMDRRGSTQGGFSHAPVARPYGARRISILARLGVRG